MPRPVRDAESDPLDHLLGELRRLCGRDRQMTVVDRMVQVERVLATLGWDTHDPTQVARRMDDPSGPVRLSLSLGGASRVHVCIFTTGGLPAGPSADGMAVPVEATWLTATDGLLWRVWRAPGEGRPVEEIDIADRDAPARLRAHLSKHSHATRSVERTETEKLAAMLHAVGLYRRNEDSPGLDATIVARLRSAGLESTPHEVRALLARVDGVVEEVLRHMRGASTAPGGSRRQGDGSQDPSGLYHRPPGCSANCPGGEVLWPPGATHVLSRKGFSSFIRYCPETRSTVLLPGSVMRAVTGASFPR